MTVRVFHANSGSCGGCDNEIGIALYRQPRIEMVITPADADVWLITGILNTFIRNYLTQVLLSTPQRPYIIATGLCAVNGQPFGRGGLADAPEIPVSLRLLGCPVRPDDIISAIYNARSIRN
ncbi:MAG: NADH:ubiquinone oxidoreductase [Chloroflexi bacterium]|nr:NADH:ubiquinone oxidoreductase [Chloroflexota bacterium]